MREHVEAGATLEVLRLVHETAKECRQLNNLQGKYDGSDLFEREPLTRLLQIKRHQVGHGRRLAHSGVSGCLDKHKDAQRNRKANPDERKEACAAAVNHIEIAQVAHPSLSDVERQINDAGANFKECCDRKVDDLELFVLLHHVEVVAGQVVNNHGDANEA